MCVQLQWRRGRGWNSEIVWDSSRGDTYECRRKNFVRLLKHLGIRAPFEGAIVDLGIGWSERARGKVLEERASTHTPFPGNAVILNVCGLSPKGEEEAFEQTSLHGESHFVKVCVLYLSLSLAEVG